MSFNFRIENNTTSEVGCFKKLYKDKFVSNKDVLFIVDEGFSDTELFNQVFDQFRNVSRPIKINISGKNEPTYNDLNAYLKIVRKQHVDLIIGVGGGSAMDCAKAISVLINNTENPLDYRGFDKIKKKGVPLWLIPTNAGTGSEASFNASFVDTSSNRKMGINGNHMFAEKSFLDAETTLSCPKLPLMGAAVDAIVHSVEGYICKNANTFSDMMALKSLELLLPNTEKLFCNWEKNKEDLEIRQSLLEGAYLAGIVQMNSGSGISAAISYPLSVYYKVPHGIGGGMFLPHIMSFNFARGFKKQENIIKNFHVYLKDLFIDMGVSEKLSIFGIYKKDKSFLMKIMTTQQPAFDQNPIHFSTENDFSDLIDNFLE